MEEIGRTADGGILVKMTRDEVATLTLLAREVGEDESFESGASGTLLFYSPNMASWLGAVYTFVTVKKQAKELREIADILEGHLDKREVEDG